MALQYTAMRGPALLYSDGPITTSTCNLIEYESDAIILLADGQIVDIGPASKLMDTLDEDIPIEVFEHCRLIKTSILAGA